MISFNKYKYIGLLFFVSFCLLSCKKGTFNKNDYTAYFGGEILNPTNKYVILYKDHLIVDSILLDENNHFYRKYDSLSPGLYTLKNESESQHIYFEKNDSLTLSVDAKNFNETLVFGGRGDLKNNFLVDLDLKNENDRYFLYDYYAKSHEEFIPAIDSIYKNQKKFYENRKKDINWSSDFDVFAKSYVDYNHFIRFELYPYIFYRRTGNEVVQQLPKNYYNYRDSIDVNDLHLASFQPYTSYLMAMLNNIVYQDCIGQSDISEIALTCTIEKIKIANNIFKNENLKNIIINNIAFLYLLEDQNSFNNKSFLDTYLHFSTDKSAQVEVFKIYNNAQHLKPNLTLPDEILIDANGVKKSLRSIINSPTVIYFWSDRALGRLESAEEKIKELKKTHPEYRFIAINIDDCYLEWKKVLRKYNPENISDFYHNSNYKSSKDKWLISKIQRTIILNKDGTIKNAFANLLDSKFDTEL